MRITGLHRRRTSVLRRAVGLHANITLDGVPVSRVLVADEALGYVCRYAADAAGQLVKRPDGPGLVVEHHYGTVAITLKEDAPEATRRCYEVLRARERR